MKDMKGIALGFVLMLAVAAPALAQDQTAAPAAGRRAGQGARGQGRRGAGIATMPVNVLDYFVTLKDDQKTKITTIQDKLKTDLKDAAGDRTKMRELNTQATTEIQAVLTDDQKTKLRENAPMLGVIQQSRAIPVALIPDLKLTDDQKTKIKDAAKETQEKMTVQPRPDAATRQTILADFKTKVDGILTDSQKKMITEHAPKNAPAP